MLPYEVGVWSGELRRADAGVVARCAAEIEQLGFTALWLPGFHGEPPGAPLTTPLAATDELIVATGILNVWDYDAQQLAETHERLEEESGDRFLLGLGVSHPVLVDREEPGRYRLPLTRMSAFLDELDAADPPVPHDEIVLAALGPRMVRLSAERTAGAHPYLTPPEHTRMAREAMGPDAYLAPEQAVLLEADPGRAREIGRAFLGRYLELPNYTANLERLGFEPTDMVDGGSDALVDAVIAWGDGDAVAARVQAHLDAGADHVCVQALGGPAGEPPRALWRDLASALGVGR